MPAPLSMPSTPKQSTPPVCCDLDDEPGKGVGSCRVCWEHDQVTALVSPCKCSGTQLLLCAAGWLGGAGVACLLSPVLVAGWLRRLLGGSGGARASATHSFHLHLQSEGQSRLGCLHYAVLPSPPCRNTEARAPGVPAPLAGECAAAGRSRRCAPSEQGPCVATGTAAAPCMAQGWGALCSWGGHVRLGWKASQTSRPSQRLNLRCLPGCPHACLTRIPPLSGLPAERAFRCSVCRTLFSVPPRRPRSGVVALQALRGIAGALCIGLLAFGLTGAAMRGRECRVVPCWAMLSCAMCAMCSCCAHAHVCRHRSRLRTLVAPAA